MAEPDPKPGPLIPTPAYFPTAAGSCKTPKHTFQTGCAIWKVYFEL